MVRRIILFVVFWMITVSAHAQDIKVTATAYCYGSITALGMKPQFGMIAVSKDLKQYLGKLAIYRGSIYAITDRMHPRWKERIDFYLPSENWCISFGKQTVTLTILR